MDKKAKPVVKSTWESLLAFWGPIALLIIIGFILAWFFVEPAPPKKIVIAAGRKDGDYYAYAQQYAKTFEKNGIVLEIRETRGSVENYTLLDDEKSNVDLAIVQGGTMPPQLKDELESIASVYFEPLWVFYAGDEVKTELSAFSGKKIAVGPEGSGTRALSIKLLNSFGITEGQGTQFLPIGGIDASLALKSKEIDVAMFVGSPRSEVVMGLLSQPGIQLLNFRHANGIGRNLPFLSPVTLYEGSIDFKANLPRKDVQLVAPAAMLVTRKRTHKAVVLLTAQAATNEHGNSTLLSDAGDFPSAKYLEAPISPVAAYYLKNGPSLLMRTFPFWLASMIERTTILLLPLLTLLLPMIRLAPPLYTWRVRAKIYKWYKEIRQIDEAIRDSSSLEQLRELKANLRRLDNEIRSVSVPLSYMREFYDLRVHTELVDTKIDERLNGDSLAVPSPGAGGVVEHR